eukprot:s3501_g8.t1
MAVRYRAGRDLKSGLENLTRRSQRRWIEVEGDYCDDVTVVFIAPKSEAKAAPDTTGPHAPPRYISGNFVSRKCDFG